MDSTTNMIWPYPTVQPNSTINWNYQMLYSLSYDAQESIRKIIADELRKALHPETECESTTVELERDGKRYRGMLYLVEEDAED